MSCVFVKCSMLKCWCDLKWGLSSYNVLFSRHYFFRSMELLVIALWKCTTSDNKTGERNLATSPPHMDGIPYTLQWAAPSRSKLPLPMGSGQPSNAHFLGPTRVHNPNGISIGSADFCRADDGDRPTDHAAQSLAIGCIYVQLRCGLKADGSQLGPRNNNGGDVADQEVQGSRSPRSRSEWPVRLSQMWWESSEVDWCDLMFESWWKIDGMFWTSPDKHSSEWWNIDGWKELKSA